MLLLLRQAKQPTFSANQVMTISIVSQINHLRITLFFLLQNNVSIFRVLKTIIE